MEVDSRFTAQRTTRRNILIDGMHHMLASAGACDVPQFVQTFDLNQPPPS